MKFMETSTDGLRIVYNVYREGYYHPTTYDVARNHIIRLLDQIDAMDDWQTLQDDIAAWASKQFPHQTPHSKLEHMRSEIEELDADPTDLGEYADCFMLLIDTARLAGYNMSDIFDAVGAKLEINRQRKWSEPDENGVSYHIKDESD